MKTWSLVNLVCIVLSAITSVVSLFKKAEEADYLSEDDYKVEKKRLFRTKLSSVLVSALGVDIFALTNSFAGKMVLANKWTLSMVLLLASNLFVYATGKQREQEKEEEK